MTAAANGIASVWSVYDWSLRAQLLHTSSVQSVCYSADGLLLLTAADYCGSRVWDAADDYRLLTQLSHDDLMDRAFFSRSGNQIITMAQVNNAHLKAWSLPS